MKLFILIKNILVRLINFGIDKNLPHLELRKLKLLNVIVFSITGILLFFLFLNLLQGKYILAISDLVLFFVVCIPSWYLQFKKHYNANIALITSAFFVSTTIITIMQYDTYRQTEHILIGASIMPIFLFDGWRKHLMFSFFPISFFLIRFVIMYRTNGAIELETLHLIYLLTFLTVYVVANYFKADMVYFNNKLESANKTKDKLFRIISHDLKNPFSSLLGTSELQLKYLETENFEKLEKSANIINMASNKIYYLTQTLLDWSLTQTENFTVKKENINLDEIIEQVVDFCNLNAKPKEVELIYNSEIKYKIQCDIIMTQIAIRNIIMNAIKFSHRNSKVLINTELVSKNIIAIIIKDQGVGMTEAQVKNIFDENNLESSFGTEKERGTGLGLRISKELIEKQNGHIFVESILAQGSKFTITIPIA